MAADSSAVPLTEAQRTELDRRIAEHKSAPGGVIRCEEVKTSIAGRHKNDPDCRLWRAACRELISFRIEPMR